MKAKIKEILDNLLSDWADGKVDNPDQALTQILEEVEKGMLSEEEIMEIIKSDELDDCYKYEPIKYKYRKRLAHALYTAQKERKL